MYIIHVHEDGAENVILYTRFIIKIVNKRTGKGEKEGRTTYIIYKTLK